MFYIFILESIGTSELLLIGLVALIVFGPRKLPEFARMLGKARNEFKRTTNEFKQTWEREVDFENLEPENSYLSNMPNTTSGNSIRERETLLKNEIAAPEIKELSQSDFENSFPKKAVVTSQKDDLTDKRDWL